MNDAERTLLEDIRGLADTLVDENIRRNMTEAADLLEEVFLDDIELQEDLPDEDF